MSNYTAISEMRSNSDLRARIEGCAVKEGVSYLLGVEEFWERIFIIDANWAVNWKNGKAAGLSVDLGKHTGTIADNMIATRVQNLALEIPNNQE